MNFLGIDPGMSGALALLDPDGKLVDGWPVDMPTMRVTKSRRAIAPADLVGVLEDCRAFHGPYRAIVEQQGCRPRDGGAAGFKTGTGFGMILGILAAMKVSHEIVVPRRWQGAILGKLAPGTSKDRARAKAQQLWPGADFGTRKTQDRSDALCIALYGLQRWRAHP